MKTLRYFILSAVIFSLGSCQKEEETIVQDETQSFVQNSPIAGLLSRTTQNPTAVDNVLDNSSCFSVQLPVTVIVNGQQIVVTDQADYQTVQNAIDAFSDDDDIVNFVYPITIQYQNFETQLLQNAGDLDDALDECGDDDGFDEIDCISLIYPITINIYDSNNQLANTVTITSNSDLYNFLENLSSNVFVAISYPISAIDSNGVTVVINSNQQLENFMEEAIDDCDDDNSGGNNNNTELSQLLMEGSWHVSYSFVDNQENTAYYNGFNFTFLSNENVIAQRNTTTVEGDWDLDTENGYQRLSLNFDGSQLEDLETNWRVIEYSTTIIRLKKQHSDRTDYVNLTKN